MELILERDFHSDSGAGVVAVEERREGPEIMDSTKKMVNTDLLEIITSRRSIRKFHPDMLSQDQIATLIEALLSAPSAGNLQSRKFFFVMDKDLQHDFARAALGQELLAEAPLVIVACTDSRIEDRYGSRGLSLYSIMDVSASVQNVLLTAHSMGLGACWVGAFNEDGVHMLLDLPRNLRPVALVPVGYSAEDPEPPPRVRVESAVKFVRGSDQS